MSQSARDPFWRAKVAREVAAHPKLRAVIEDTCTRCHAPAQQYPLRAKNQRQSLAALNELGLDGVTCTVCHQIEPGNLGTPASFTAGFTIGTNDRIFGPHPEPFTMPMVMHTDFTPTEGKHLRDAALCGSCHTVIHRPEGATRDFVEQAPYLEWRASRYPAEGRTCQSCHMPDLGRPEYIAHRPPGGPFPPTNPRTPFGLHFFRGANTVFAPNEEMRNRNRAFLSTALRLETKFADGALAVTIHNLTGHKLPTAYPSRRLWLHVIAEDASGNVVFQSGAWDNATGRLRAPWPQPHRREIRSDSEAAIFDAQYVDIHGRPTTSLIAAAAYGKDNRILPAGFTPSAPIDPVGVSGDPTFQPGSATVLFRLPPTARSARVQALYQTLAPEYPDALPGNYPPVVLATTELTQR
jgi:hypothetical protein